MAERSTINELKKIKCKEIYLFVSLWFINIVNYMDRLGIASILIKIQKIFSISDSYLGLLQTLLLIGFFCSAPAFGYWGDRFSRKWLIILSTFIWIISTVFGACATQFWMLLISRMLVGVGQSGFTTISPTVLADIAINGARTVLLSVFYLGIPVGCGLGYIITSAVSEATGSWRYGICIGPIFCFIGTLLLIFASFPKRGEKEVKFVYNIKTTSFIQDIKYLTSIPSYIGITAAFTCICFLAGALSYWMPTCLSYGFQLFSPKSLNTSQTHLYIGAVTLLTGILGVLIGLLLSRLLRHRYPHVDALICGFGLLISGPISIGCLSVISKSQILTFILMFFAMLNLNLNWAVVTDMLFYIVKPSRRTFAQGLHIFIGHGFGDCISPFIVGALSDYFNENIQFTNSSAFLPHTKGKPTKPGSLFQHFHSLQLSLSIIFIFSLLGAIFFFVASCFVIRDTDRASKQDSPSPSITKTDH